jgi:hypothetical protein
MKKTTIALLIMLLIISLFAVFAGTGKFADWLLQYKFTGGSSTGTVNDGLYSGGIYVPGTEYAGVTISAITTVEGKSGGFSGMGGAPPR